MAINLKSNLYRPFGKFISRSRLPQLEGELRFAGLQEQVEILRDQWGVPHIYANDLSDLFFAQGFVHAQDRFWQMEFNRRLVAGRLSEILGQVTLPLDRWMRTLTLSRIAEFEESMLNEKTKGYLQIYANGINTFLAQNKLPIEFTLLRFKPEPWSISDTLGWIKMMAWSLSVNWESELLRAKLIQTLGADKAAELEIDHLSRWPYIIPPNTDYSQINLDSLNHYKLAKPFLGPSPYEGLGSNNWVLSGNLTSSGKPILANDMHLALTLPSIWYENHLCSAEFSFTGVTFPGIPGVVAGHNGKVAWGYTNGFPDVQDLYMEILRKNEDGTVEALYNDQWEKAKVLHELIQIKGMKSVTHEVILTRHGPIINELAPDLAGDQALALKWTALDPDTMIQTMFEIACASNITEFQQALKYWTTPAQNIVYADVSGNIGYTLAGKIPLRKKGSGRTPVPGWTDEFEWYTYVPFEMLPRMDNPEQGFIVTANNRVFDSSYPMNIEIEPITGDRAQRISEMILDPELRQGQEKIDIEFIKRMQYDLCSPSARSIAKSIGEIKFYDSTRTEETKLKNMVRLFHEWDGVLASTSTEAAIYETFIRKLVWLMLKDKLDPNPESSSSSGQSKTKLITEFMGKGPTPVLAEAGLFGDHWLPWLINQLCDPHSPWFDLGSGETRDDLIIKALIDSNNYLTKRFGSDWKTWNWGKIHKLTFAHPLGSNLLLGNIFNMGPYPIGGDHTTVCATGSSYHNLDTTYIVGAPFRMIIDLSDLDNSASILAPGQSGNPASPHYADQIPAWFHGDYHPMLYTRSKIEKHTTSRLVLLPG